MRPNTILYPSIGPYNQQMIDMKHGHSIYVEQCGNPDGAPVVVLHGGPGGGCSPAMRRFFNPEHWRIILFDQRGCGRSKPHASVEDNTTWDLVADIERIRETLGIDRWVVFGGSWGATLGLVYAQSHPDHVRHLVLRGVYLSMQEELDWFYGGGAARFWPERWENFLAPIAKEEQDDLISAYHRRLFSGNEEEEMRYAAHWLSWENALATVSGGTGAAPSSYARAFARLENHYFIHKGFLATNNAILDAMPIISHIGGTIVQGRLDMVCPPYSAYRLAQHWPRADLRMIAGAGHALSEPGITLELVRVMQELSRASVGEQHPRGPII